MNVIPVPSTLDDRTYDELLGSIAGVGEGPVLVDARHMRWIDPNGLVVLIAAGAVLRGRIDSPPRLHPPDSSEVSGYLKKSGFVARSEGIFELPETLRRETRANAPSDVLLEVTPIAENHDVHGVVDRIQERAGEILARRLGYPASSVVQFSVLLSEVCQNIVEHADGPGWVAAQAYRSSNRFGRPVVVIAVGDVGQGFRSSLAREHSARYSDRWGDRTALEAAFIHGMTRFPDSGRGQGIQQIRRQVRRWNGGISIRSGTARIADVPEWDDRPPMEEGLAPFPGAQITIVLPAYARQTDG